MTSDSSSSPPSWRAQALRGDRRAFGVAHAFEVERRRRLRESQLQQLDRLEPMAPRSPWWKFWQPSPSDPARGPTPTK